MVAEAMEEYFLAFVEAAYEDPGEQASMGFMATGEDFIGIPSWETYIAYSTNPCIVGRGKTTGGCF